MNGQGTVTNVSAKPFTDKWGKSITLYSFQIGGDNAYYRTGTNEPQCKQGDIISFDFEQAGQNKKVNPHSIQVTGQGNVQSTGQGSPQAARGGNSRDDYWANKEKYDKEVTQPRISYAAAQKGAIALVTAALANDVLGFGNAKKADKMEMLLGYVSEVTDRLAVKLDAGHEIVESLREANGSIEPTFVDEDAMYDQAS
jgi:hypothetical protein